MRYIPMALIALPATMLATAAMAAPVPNGTVSSVATFNPTVTFGTGTSTYSAMNGSTFEISGTGGFSNLSSTMGSLNGVLTFSNTVGAVMAETLPNSFTFTFDDARGGNYSFSVASVQTNSFVNIANSFSSATLYALGTLVDTHLNYTSTPASLSIQFNSTGGSAFSSALTLAVPPSGAVPEPGVWAMMLVGVGAVGVAMRRRRNVTTRVRFA